MQMWEYEVKEVGNEEGLLRRSWMKPGPKGGRYFRSERDPRNTYQVGTSVTDSLDIP